MDPTARLRALAASLTPRSHAPFSGRPTGAVALLSDGAWVAGVRVESSAFPTTIAAAQAALASAFALGRQDIVAVAQSEPFAPGEAEAWAAWLAGTPAVIGPDFAATTARVPGPGRRLTLALPDTAAVGTPLPDAEGLRLAREAARHAYTPASGFPVGAVVQGEDGRLVAGANVEHPDWTRGLCAERVALAAAAAEGVGSVARVWVTCLQAAECSPCGACRQLLSERAPDAAVVMDGHDASARVQPTTALLPGGFGAAALGR